MESLSSAERISHCRTSSFFPENAVVENIEILPDVSTVELNDPTNEYGFSEEADETLVEFEECLESESAGSCSDQDTMFWPEESEELDGSNNHELITSGIEARHSKNISDHEGTNNSLTENSDTGLGLAAHSCKDCNEIFGNEADLKLHSATHVSELEICDECGLSFQTAFMLKKHKKSHTADRKFKCDICYSLFREKSSLKRHKLKHTVELPFCCSICCLRFISDSELKTHARTHEIPPTTGTKKSSKLKTQTETAESLPPAVNKKPSKLKTYNNESPPSNVEKSPLKRQPRNNTKTVEIENNEIEGQNKSPAKRKAKAKSKPKSSTTGNGDNGSNAKGSDSGLSSDLNKNEDNLDKHIDGNDSSNTLLSGAEENDSGQAGGNISKSWNNTKKKGKRHQCSTCSQSFYQKASLTAHERKHTGERPFKCQLCNYSSRTKNCLTLHVKSHSDARPYACDSCDLKFKLKHHLSNHKLIHLEEKPFTCDICGWSCRQVAKYNAHKKDHLTLEVNPKESKGSQKKNKTVTRQKDRDGAFYKCQECDAVIKGKCGLRLHKRFVHLKDLPHLCDICGVKSRSKAHLKLHKLTHTGEKRFKCRFCEYSSILKTGLVHHERIHTGERPYQCDTCGKTFRLKNHLKNHSLIHSNERPHKCDQCNADFRQIGALLLHKTTHTDEKPFECDECEEKFRLKAELRKHKITHSVTNPFKCDECGSIFRLKAHLQQHKKTHQITDRSYKCDQCDSTFRQLTHLTQHKKSHTTEKPFKCQLCPSAFRVRSNLRRHELGHSKKGQLIVPSNMDISATDRISSVSDDNTKSNGSFHHEDNYHPNVVDNFVDYGAKSFTDFSHSLCDWSKNFRPRTETFQMRYSGIEEGMEASSSYRYH